MVLLTTRGDDMLYAEGFRSSGSPARMRAPSATFSQNSK
jgi:hypothetical protein